MPNEKVKLHFEATGDQYLSVEPSAEVEGGVALVVVAKGARVSFHMEAQEARRLAEALTACTEPPPGLRVVG